MRAREVRLGTRRVVTLLGNPGHLAMLVGSLDTATPRRRVVRGALVLASRTRTLPLLSRRSDDDPELKRCLAPVRDLVEEDGAVMVVWPPGDRVHRRYVAVSDARGRLTAFAKVSTAPTEDGPALRTECAVLTTLGAEPLANARSPRVLSSVEDDGLVALVLEAIPADREHLTWDEVIELLPLRRTGSAGASTHRANRPHVGGSASFLTLAATASPGERDLANGDIRPSNAVRAGGQVWVFDWEFASFDAPLATDLVSALLTRRVETSDTGDAQRVVDDLLLAAADRGVVPRDVAAAVGYLAAAGQPWAITATRQEWPGAANATERTS